MNTQPFSQTGQFVCRVFVYELIGCEFESSCSHLLSCFFEMSAFGVELMTVSLEGNIQLLIKLSLLNVNNKKEKRKWKSYDVNLHIF